MLFTHETNLLQRKQFLKDPVVIYFEKGQFHLRDGATDSQVKQIFLWQVKVAIKIVVVTPCSYCQTLTMDQTWRFVCVILLNFIANLQIRNLSTKEIVQGRAQGQS